MRKQSIRQKLILPLLALFLVLSGVLVMIILGTSSANHLIEDSITKPLDLTAKVNTLNILENKKQYQVMVYIYKKIQNREDAVENLGKAVAIEAKIQAQMKILKKSTNNEYFTNYATQRANLIDLEKNLMHALSTGDQTNVKRHYNIWMSRKSISQAALIDLVTSNLTSIERTTQKISQDLNEAIGLLCIALAVASCIIFFTYFHYDKLLVTPLNKLKQFIIDKKDLQSDIDTHEVEQFNFEIKELYEHFAETFSDLSKSMISKERLKEEIKKTKKAKKLAQQNALSLQIANDKLTRRTEELDKLNKKNLALATHDPLTGIPNRKLLMDRLEQDILQAERQPTSFALLFLDLDGFKEVNDTYGHDYGDCILIHFAKILRQCIRKTDTLARLGGDEFVIVLKNLHDSNEPSKVSELILQSIAKPFDVKGKPFKIEASIGIAFYPTDADNVTGLINNADTAMYAAKEAGKNTFKYYKEEMQQIAMDNLRLRSVLQAAWDNNEFTIYYQPIVNNQQEIVSCEALLRWDSSQYGILTPIYFLEALEKNGLIIPVGFWIIEAVRKQQQRWFEETGQVLDISINISPKQFQSKAFTEKLISLAKQSDIDCNKLIIELTECNLVDEPELLLRSLHELKSAGLTIAVDDYGTGYSSVSYLCRFPIDIVKIDKIFIRDITNNTTDQIIVDSTIRLAHDLGLRIIAEGVETKEQVDFLEAKRCDYIQGYYYDHPYSAEEITRLLNKKKE